MKTRWRFGAAWLFVLCACASSPPEQRQEVGVATDVGADDEGGTVADVGQEPAEVVAAELSSSELTPTELPPADESVVAVNLSAGGFFGSPYPSDARGVAAIADFPNPDGVALVTTLTEMAAQSGGFGQTSGVFFTLTGEAGPLPDLAATVTTASPVQLIDIDADPLPVVRRIPSWVSFARDGGPYGAPNLLSIVPLQGVPLRPNARHVAVILRSLGDATGRPLRAGAFDADVTEALLHVGISPGEVAGATVFTTGDATAGLVATTAAARAEGVTLTQAPALTQTYEDFCVFEGRVSVPVYQAGVPPFAETGGAWALGAPTVQAHETARLLVTVPRKVSPTLGFPTTVFVRTGGGGDRPLVDRGVHAVAHGEAEPGTGPAAELALIGFAGVSIDGPHGGLRNVSGGDEQFLMFNVLNPWALRDNVRQSALELALLPDLLATLEIDAAACPGAPAKAHFDMTRLALMGHSMGATISPLVLSVEERYRAAVISGAGSSLIENVLHKKSPTPVRPLIESLFGFSSRGLSVTQGDPLLSLIQWATEPSDPPPYGHMNAASILMVQGIVDTYILPPISNATSLSLGLDLAGPSLDDAPALAEFPRTAELLPLVGRTVLPLPVVENRDGRTVVVVQHAQDGIEDGHEAFFQLSAPKAQYRRFLETYATVNTPDVPAAP